MSLVKLALSKKTKKNLSTAGGALAGIAAANQVVTRLGYRNTIKDLKKLPVVLGAMASAATLSGYGARKIADKYTEEK